MPAAHAVRPDSDSMDTMSPAPDSRNGPRAAAPAQAGALEEEAYAALRHALLFGGFAPGDRLSIRGVAARLELSPMPVRAAIRRLVSERALDTTAAGTAVVPRLTRAGFEELTGLRVQLEPHALALAAPRITPEQVAAVQGHLDAFAAAKAAGDPAATQRADTEFLFALFAAAESPLLLSFIESLWLRRGPLFWEARWVLLSASTLHARHEDILAALREGDGAAAAAALAADITRTAEVLLEAHAFE